MSEYVATVEWQRNDAKFTDNRYSRAHSWRFDGGVTVPASASPHVLPPPLSDPSGVDPEEAFVAAVASCHMLWFLALAARKGVVVDSYRDEAVGVMEKNDQGKLAITRVTLRPDIRYGGTTRPPPGDIDALHHAAHDSCFIANSVRSIISVDGVGASRP